MASAWAAANRLVLGQRYVKDKSNDIRAIPELLHLLDRHGYMVTVDALSCQHEVARAIRAQGANYLLAVKGNQGHWLEDVKDLFTEAEAAGWRDALHGYGREVYGDHGAD